VSQVALAVSEHDLGIPEAAWLASPRLAALAPLVPADVAALVSGSRAPRMVVLAPHPDDEILAVGGLLATLAQAGWQIDVVAVTDGEGSHPRSRTVTPPEIARLRAREREHALACLGLDRAGVTRLACPDSAVRDVRDLPERLAGHLGHECGARVCLSPWERDGHPDHDAVGRAARRACRELGVPLLEYPVWAWHWASPDGDELPWSRARRFDLDGETRAAKGRAIAAYRSQVESLGPGVGDEAILPPAVLARFHRPFEVLFA
jgi:LmbE family N-acetylglucosaminyl deacetylase